ncbi:hypothetical protein GCM10007140_22410 [Priestia taiwanensis]|uniref:Uncharacterized protein n=1 Tax=Priestia taiwanensis TaxID=1347902 RepID=A0A917ATK0_9BACI|nr:hypothetical protein GCM10007140_22410 [Priestia taiwanensis]
MLAGGCTKNDFRIENAKVASTVYYLFDAYTYAISSALHTTVGDAYKGRLVSVQIEKREGLTLLEMNVVQQGLSFLKKDKEG